jgi:type I restriction enzyme S subunit
MKSAVIHNAEDRVTERAVADGMATPLPAGTLLVVTRSGILAHSVPVAVTAIEVAINQDIKALIPADGVDARFLAEQLRARAPELLAHAMKTGTTVESLVFDRLKSFPIRLAPTGEQRRIADRLVGMRIPIAAAREQADRLTEAAASIRDALADRMAQGRLTTFARPRHGSVAVHRLSELLVEAGRTGLSVKGQLEPPGVRALRLSALRGPVVDMDDVRYLPVDEERTRHLALKVGDVLISRGSGTRMFVGRASLVRRASVHTIFPDTSFRVRLDPDRVLPEWFVAVWNSSVTRREFEPRIRTTAGIWKIGWRDLRDVDLRVPTIDEQRDAVEAFRAARARLDLALAKRDRAAQLLRRFEQTMVARAFDGQLVPQFDNEEDAVALLERIKARPVTPPRRRIRKVDMPSTRDAFRELVTKLPDGGQSFEEIRQAIPSKYDDLRDAVFEALAEGAVLQRFDDQRGAMLLVRAS